MTGISKRLLLLSAIFASIATLNILADNTPGKDALRIKALAPIIDVDTDDYTSHGQKLPFTVKRGDCKLTLGGKFKIEHFFIDNAYLLNKNIPDENEYFKETVDITLGTEYGQEKYGHKAVETFMSIRHKGIWGLGLTYADKDSGSIAPSNIKFGNDSDAIFGSHSHTNGKALLWLKDGWLRFSVNAALGWHSENLQFIKMGWFPFELGRGIALGGFYGLNKELLGLYSYPEEKGAPGINLHGTIVKDYLDYDLYYAKFEERNKNFGATINLEKRHIVGRSATPWRGVNKDDEVFAARLKWKAVNNDCLGTLELEPYVFYNAASDQKVEIAPDAKVNWGSYGLGLEYSYGNFEFGGETAFNYGKEELFNIDRNRARITNRNGQIVEEYSHIIDMNTNQRALVTPASKAASLLPVNQVDNQQIGGTQFKNGTSRFRPAYENKFGGWMVVVDGAYTFEPWNLELAVAYGYASGDDAPHSVEKNKTYHGFVGLHELYSGKRVSSVLLLDERFLMRPVSLAGSSPTKINAAQDLFFSDLQHVGVGATWTPKFFIKDLSLNANIVAFWKAHQINKFIADATNPAGGAISPTDKARNYMGTELNLLSRCTVIKDLTLFVNIAGFIPGGFFADLKGVPLSGDFFQVIVDDPRNDVDDATKFRLSNDTSFYVNVGFEYKF